MNREDVNAKERGRPIDPSKNNLILNTTLNLLADIGFLNLTMDKIAKEAKVSKAAIYRRWSSKEELVLEAVRLIDPFDDYYKLLGTGNSQLALRDQLVDLLCHCFLNGGERHEYFMTVFFAALPHVNMGNQDLHRDFNSNLQKAIETTLKPFLSAEQIEKKGKILSDLVPALVAYQVLLLRQKVTKRYIENIVDEIMMPAIKC